MNSGFIHLYTGPGKGKTTAAAGLALRAISRNLKVAWIEYHKNRTKNGDGETGLFKKLGADVYNFAPDTPFFNKKVTKESIREQCLESFKLIRDLFTQGRHDIIVLDEINNSTSAGYITTDELKNLLREKPAGLELILTGRGAAPEIVKMADLVTEMNEIKHYFKSGIKSRKGIEL